MLINLSDLVSPNLSALFRKIPKTDLLYLNFSLAPKTSLTNISKFGCFKKCLLNEFCSYVVFKNGRCGLHTEFAKKGFISSNTDSLYERKPTIEYFFKNNFSFFI